MFVNCNNRHIRSSYDVPMQVCKSYDIKLRNEREGAYEECQKPVYETMTQ